MERHALNFVTQIVSLAERRKKEATIWFPPLPHREQKPWWVNDMEDSTIQSTKSWCRKRQVHLDLLPPLLHWEIRLQNVSTTLHHGRWYRQRHSPLTVLCGDAWRVWQHPPVAVHTQGHLQAHQPGRRSRHCWHIQTRPNEQLFQEAKVRHEHCQWVSSICLPHKAGERWFCCRRYHLHQVHDWHFYNMSSLNNYYYWLVLCNNII